MNDEIGHLVQGRNKTGLKGTNFFQFILYTNIPITRRKDVAYPRIVVDYQPQKEKPNWTRITVGGNNINYLFTVTTQTAELCTHKLLINSVVSTTSASVQTAYNSLLLIIVVGWSIYPLGYVFGYLMGAVDASTLNLIYNLADFVNKILFGLVIWKAAVDDKQTA